MPIKKVSYGFQDITRTLAERIRLQATRPNVYGYNPHDKQIQFHSAPGRGRLYVGGNRSGKTTGGVIEDIWWITGKHPYRQTPDPPVRGRSICVDFLNGIEKIVRPEVARWLPLSELKGGSWATGYNKELRMLTLENGSTLEFMCVDDETEVLTKRGWKHRLELLDDDMMLTYNSEIEMTEWKQIETLYVNEDYSGKMVRFSPYSTNGVKTTIDAFVTPNHKWVTDRGLRRTDELTILENIKLVSECNDEEVFYDDDDFVALSGWIAGDGAIYNDGARIYQSHNNYDKQCIIQDLVENSGYRYSTWQNSAYKVWKLYGQFQKKLDVTLMTKEQREYYLEALLLSDGTIEPTGKWQFTNTDMELIDLVMMLGTLCGYRVSMSERPLSKWGKKNVYCVMGRSKSHRQSVQTVRNSKMSTEYYKGTVWCPGSSNQTFVARRNGTVYITGNSYDQQLDKFAGTSRHFVHFDEEPPQTIYIENRARLIDTGGSYWITMTPVLGMDWVYDDIYMVGKNDPTSNIDVIEVDMTDNPYISPGEIEEFISGLTPDERIARVKGKFVRVGGLVFKFFDPNIHVVDAFIPPRNWEWYVSLDHGYNNPTAIYWHAVSPDNKVVTFSEAYDNERTVDYWASLIHTRNSGFGRPPDYYVADPAIAQRQAVTGASIQTEYAERGINFILGQNDVLSGINRMTQYLKVEARSNEPLWSITRNCNSLIWEMQRLRWKTWKTPKMQSENNPHDAVHKKDDHAFDSCRYFFTVIPDLTPMQTLIEPGERVWVAPPNARDVNIDTMRLDTNVFKVREDNTEWHREGIDETVGGIW